jgi:hypothetical protein
MSGEEDKIYADTSQPATLIDGDILSPTLGDAVVALDKEPRKNVATIKVKDRVFTVSEIDRLHHRKTRST